MANRIFKAVMSLGVLLAIVAALSVSFGRLVWEREYKDVGITIEYKDVVKLSSKHGYPDGELLFQLRERKVDSLALYPVELEEFAALLTPVELEMEEEEKGGPLVGRFFESDVTKLRAMGFGIVLRPINFQPPTSDPVFFERYLERLGDLEPRQIIFGGREVLGYPDYLEETTAFLKEHSSLVGHIEFGNQLGMGTLVDGVTDQFVRVHSITRDEMKSITIDDALARWERAVEERNIRRLYVRFFEDKTVEENLSYVESLVNRLNDSGFQVGRVSLAEPFEVQDRWLLVMMIGAVSLGMLNVNRVWKPQFLINLLLWVIGIAIVITGLRLDTLLTRQAVALALALLIPVSAFLYLRPVLIGERETIGSALGGGMLVLVYSSLIVVLGGIGIGALLSGEEFFLKLREFRGVKLSLVAPLVLVFITYFIVVGRDRFKAFVTRQIRMGDLILIGLGGAALVMVVLRSGNFSIVPVPELEVFSRRFLEESLFARPRFKEFLFGHPLLFLWGGVGFRSLRDYDVIVLLLGMIGQVSIINTFAHLHTPLIVSLSRTAIGVALGIIVGVILVVIFKEGERFWTRS